MSNANEKYKNNPNLKKVLDTSNDFIAHSLPNNNKIDY